MTVIGSHVKRMPKGWRIILARVQGEQESSFFISPHGKRFTSLEAVRKYIEKNPEMASTSRRKRSVESSEGKPAKRFKLSDGTIFNPPNQAQKSTEPDPEPVLSESIKRRRRQMSLRSPYRDLLKKTLVRGIQSAASKSFT